MGESFDTLHVQSLIVILLILKLKRLSRDKFFEESFIEELGHKRLKKESELFFPQLKDEEIAHESSCKSKSWDHMHHR